MSPLPILQQGRTPLNGIAGDATRATARILRKLKMPFALCGNFAAEMYIGTEAPDTDSDNRLGVDGRSPSRANTLAIRKNVEIMILLRATVLSELIVKIVTQDRKHFALVDSTGLQYRQVESIGRLETIDITISITISVHSETFLHTIDNLPIVPLFYLLMQAVEAWDGRRTAADAKFRLNRIIQLLRPPQLQDLHAKDISFGGFGLPAQRHDSVRRLLIADPTLFGDWKRLGITFGPRSHAHIRSHRVFEQEPWREYRTAQYSWEACYRAARSIVRLLRRLGLSCAILGSTACYAYGSTHCEPNDVDILALPSPGKIWTVERLKDELVSSDPTHFYLKRQPRDSVAINSTLYFKHEPLNSWTDSEPCDLYVKIDIYLPGLLQHAALPMRRTVQRVGLPLIPFPLLLLQKLQDWESRKKWGNTYRRRSDIRALRGLFGKKEDLKAVEKTRPWGDRDLFNTWFEDASRVRVKDFCIAFPKYVAVWKRLGFETASDPIPRPKKR